MMQIDATGSWGKAIERSTLGGQEVKGQGHAWPELDLEAWRRHHSGAHWVE